MERQKKRGALRHFGVLMLSCFLAAAGLWGCERAGVTDGDSGGVRETSKRKGDQKTEVQVFIAASLNTVMQELAEKFKAEHSNVEILFNADSSGTLQTQIEEGYACDLFFSASQTQMDALEKQDFLVEGSRRDLLKNYVVLIKRKAADSEVTGFKTLDRAKSFALAGGSVPVGKYTREAMVRLGFLPGADDVATILSSEISEALGGVEISEQSNVSKVLIAVKEGACEVGTTYYSDTYGYEDDIEILETAGYDLTGEVTYPAALIRNQEAGKAEKKAAKEFYQYLLTEEAAKMFRNYYFEMAQDEGTGD